MSAYVTAMLARKSGRTPPGGPPWWIWLVALAVVIVGIAIAALVLL